MVTHQFVRIESEHPGGCLIDTGNPAIGRCYDDRLVHTRQHVVDVVPGNRGSAQLVAHVVEDSCKVAKQVSLHDLERFTIVRVAELLGLYFQCPDALCLQLCHQPDHESAQYDRDQGGTNNPDEARLPTLRAKLRQASLESFRLLYQRLKIEAAGQRADTFPFANNRKLHVQAFRSPQYIAVDGLLGNHPGFDHRTVVMGVAQTNQSLIVDDGPIEYLASGCSAL